MKKTYEEAELNIIMMNGDDIVTASPGNGTPITEIDLFEEDI